METSAETTHQEQEDQQEEDAAALEERLRSLAGERVGCVLRIAVIDTERDDIIRRLYNAHNRSPKRLGALANLSRQAAWLIGTGRQPVKQ